MDALERARCGSPTRAATEQTLTTDAAGERRSSGSAARVTRTTPIMNTLFQDWIRHTVITVSGLAAAPTYTIGTASPTYVTLNLPVGQGPTTTKVDDSAATYSAGWTTVTEPPTYGGTAHQCKVATCTATFTFTGTGVSWIGQKDSNYGHASVYIDNVLVSTVDSYSATNLYQQTLSSVSNLTAGSHTLKIVPTGTHSASSTDNWMAIDALTYTS